MQRITCYFTVKFKKPTEGNMTDTVSAQNKLTKLKEKYINSLPGKVSDIYHEWGLCKTNKVITNSILTSHLHKLAGSAGMYDLFELGEKARDIELAAMGIEDSLSDELITEIDIKLNQLNTMVTNLC